MTLRPLHGLDVDRALHAAGGAVLLVVTKPGCGACRAVKAAIDAVDAPAELAAYEVDAGSAPALVEELGVFHLPALWLFAEGEPVAEIAAEAVPARLGAALRSALGASRPRSAPPSDGPRRGAASDGRARPSTPRAGRAPVTIPPP